VKTVFLHDVARGTAVGQVSRLQLYIKGTVQGVGFRPFVYRLATDLRLTGWVKNTLYGVQIELEGDTDRLQQFTDRLSREKPVLSRIDGIELDQLLPSGYSRFMVKESDDSGEIEAVILPDVATCEECRHDIFDPSNRRYRYPFTNCTNCGPRFSIIEALPYDRANTTMRRFIMCEECRQEYENPYDRRFHAQPNACPNCGPHLELWDSSGTVLADHDKALLQACSLIRDGGVLALKGLGGFQLIVDAGNHDAVQCLRERKIRPEKPLALMYSDLSAVEKDCELSELEKTTLKSIASPIVLLKRKLCIQPARQSISDLVAPDNPYLGVMLPYTPLHYLLITELDGPIVATSGNRSDEPICTNEHDALVRLGGIADLYLVHNRPIAQHADDSIVREVAERSLVLRNARGYAPTVIDLPRPVTDCLAVGGHLKNSVAITKGKRAFVSQYIGDLDSLPACDVFRKVAGSLMSTYGVKPSLITCDNHPDYQSTRWAVSFGTPCETVQHHYAHVLSCMAENHLEPPLLGVAFDGTGLGTDGTIWGGEFLKITCDSFERVAHLRQFRLPGGDTAAREPRRSALGLLYEAFGEAAFGMSNLSAVKSFTPEELRVLQAMLDRGLNAPLTSSAGRLFDAVSSLLGLSQVMSFEGQAAMKLEYAAESIPSVGTYRFRLDTESTPFILDWEPMLRQLLKDLNAAVPPGVIAVKFHNALAEMIAAVAARTGERKIVLAGGCFQNKYLTERALKVLERNGFDVYRSEWIPPNDSGIALGQIMAACRLQPRGD